MNNLNGLTSETFLFTSESVGEGHPDKICDQLSDAILDSCLLSDPDSKVACEVFVKGNQLLIGGEISTRACLNLDKIVRETIKNIGYDDENYGFNYKTCKISTILDTQSPDIAHGVHEGRLREDIGAGDQGMMFGYATDETDEDGKFMPLTLVLAHALNERMAQCRRAGILSWIRPDTKSQVTLEYLKVGGACQPIRVHTIVISAQHRDDVSLDKVRQELKSHVIDHVMPPFLIDDKTIYHLNPAGRFVVGGPMADAGLTGRKIIVDSYGGWGAHGGGCFSGKDCSKVDRSGSYAARWIAKSLVKARLCRRVLVQISYAIGISKPLAVFVDSYGTVRDGLCDKALLDIVNQNFDLRPGVIIKDLKLRNQQYLKTAVYGHFGRAEFPWEDCKELKLPAHLSNQIAP